MYIIMLYNHNNDKSSNYLLQIYAFNKKPPGILVSLNIAEKNNLKQF